MSQIGHGMKKLQHEDGPFNNLIFLYKTKWNSSRTKNIDSQLCIYWREESINKMNEPPGEVECYRYWEENYTGIVPEKK
jgi:hypothetical protein